MSQQKHNSHHSSKQPVVVKSEKKQVTDLDKPQPPRPAPDDHEAWKAHWKAQNQPWRTEPEIDKERREYLAERRAIKPDIEKGIYPFKDIKLSRADVEWLVATHENGLGPVDWNDESQSKREGIDLRGANLSGEDLSKLPLVRLQGGLEGLSWTFGTEEERMMAASHMGKSRLSGVQLQQADLCGAQLKGAILLRAQLQEVNLTGAQLQGAIIGNAQLRGAILSEAQLQEAVLLLGELQEAHFVKAQLQGALLGGAQLQKAVLSQANLQGADLSEAQLQEADLHEADLQESDLRRAHLEGTNLSNAKLGNQRHIGPQLADVQWGDTNLAVVDWSQVTILGDEHEAKQKITSEGKRKEKSQRLKEYKTAVRANRQLSVALQAQGLNEDAARFAYRAQLCQRGVLWYQGWRSWYKYLGSWFLALLAGYGYKPGWTVIWYLLVIASFAFGYYEVTHLLHAQPYPLAWYEALILSVSSFHGRGFFQPVQNLGDPVAILASIEAVVGLIIEVSFIATFTQRFFGK